MTTAFADDETVTIPILSDIPTPAEVADALDEAATVIETNGLMHTAFFDRPAHDAEDGIPIADCRMDAHGAITFVTCGHPVIWHDATPHQQRMRTSAVHALSAQLGEGFIDLPGWCEYAADDDVTTAMRAAAKGLRGESA